MRNWQRCITVITAGVCLCQLSYASGLNQQKLANQTLNTTSKVTFDTVTLNADAYAAGWNGEQKAAPKDAIYDKIESLNITSPFTITSNVVYPTTKTDNLAVGTSDNLGKFVVSGDTDELQFVARAFSTQTGKIITVENQAGTDLFTVSLDGTIHSSGGIGTEYMTLGSGTQSTYIFSADVSGVDTNITFRSGNALFSGSVESAPSADPSIIFNTLTATDTDFWCGVQEDAGADNDDSFRCGTGLTPGSNYISSFLPSSFLNRVIVMSRDGAAVSGSIHNEHASDGSIDETASIRFDTFDLGIGGLTMGSIIVGKLEDFMSSNNRSSYMSFETRKDGTSAERMRISSDGTTTFAFVAVLTPRGTVPETPTSGMMYMDSTAAPDELCVYDGTGWQGISTGTDASCA